MRCIGHLTTTSQRSKTLEQILVVLRGSTIAEETGNDTESKFWATYKKVSNEYDDDFLGRANDDMAIILTFVSFVSTSVNANLTVESGWSILGCQLNLHHRNAAKPRRYYECLNTAADQNNR